MSDLRPASPAFVEIGPCWVCGGRERLPFADATLDFSAWHEQDPELAAYSGEHVQLWRCATCGFAQPDRVPALPGFFSRMYDQRWDPAWVEAESASTYKDLIFDRILDALGARVRLPGRTLLDVGCHAGRFLTLAARAGWRAEGTEINERTASHAAARTGLPIHRLRAERVAELGRRFDAVALTDVLEHIPEPVTLLRGIREVLVENGWVAIKVPSGPAQLRKETWRARLSRGYRATLADNLVHINHFSPRSLRLSLERAGFTDVVVEVAPPECPPQSPLASFVRRAIHQVASIVPGGVDTPLALHLQAFARASTPRP